MPYSAVSATAAKPVNLYLRDESRKILMGTCFLSLFNAVTAFSAYDVFYGAFAQASQQAPELNWVLSIIKPTAVISSMLGLAMGYKW